MIATIWEVWNDRHGDLNKGADVLIRLILFGIEALILHWIFDKPHPDSLLLSAAIFFFTFDYAIAYVLIRNKVIEPRIGGGYTWFSYTGKKGFFDNIGIWKKAGPWLKFSVKLVVLITAIVIWII